MQAGHSLDHLSLASPAAEPIAVSRGRSAAELDAFLAGIERRALRIAQIATRDTDEALDIVQDAMLKLARRYADRPATEWPPLFHRILENRICDWQRRQTLRRRLFLMPSARAVDEALPDPIEQVPDAAPSAPQRVAQAQAMAVLAPAIDTLPARQRQAFVLRVWDGLSVEDTATAMGCSGGSVKTHLSRALHALRAKLEGVWPS